MKVELRLLGSMKRGLECGRGGYVDAPQGISLSGFLESSRIDMSKTLVILVNGRRPDTDPVLCDGDVVSVFPPVAGG